MADKQAQAIERLVKKLSAVRKTVRGEERKLLDAMVLSAQSEVSAHAAAVKKPSMRKTPDVELHAASVSRPSVTRPSTRKTPEVELHSANVRRLDVGQKTTQAQARKSAQAESQKSAQPESRLDWRIDLADGNYRVTVI